MTTPTTDQTEDQTPTPEQEGATEQGKGKAGQDAARYRTKLRAAESERDQLAARVAAYTRADVVRHASERLEDAEDLFIVGQVDVADLVDDDGAVDVDLVDGAVDALLERRPRLGKGWEPDADDLDGGARRSAPSRGATWSGLLSGGAQR